MKLLEIFKSTDNIQLDKKTLVVLRWIAIIGQFLTINFVYFILNFDFPFFYCSTVIFFGIITNIFLQFREKKNLLSDFSSTIYLAYDLTQLAVLVFFTGGITNPFVLLLVIPAVVSSTFLSLRSTINLAFITAIFLLVLTIYYFPLPSSDELHFHVPNYYLYGIPIAIIIGLIFLCYFGARFGLENRKRTEAVNKLELVLAKEHELKTIGVQAAASAHSLSTPLSTIKLVSKELEKEMGSNNKYLLTYQNARHNIAPHPAPSLAKTSELDIGHYYEPAWSSMVLNNNNKHFSLAMMDCYLKQDQDKCSYLGLSGNSNQKPVNGQEQKPWKGFDHRYSTGMSWLKSK